MRTTESGTQFFFSDATLQELTELLILLPSVCGVRLESLIEWAEEKQGYYSGEYKTGTRWLIEMVKWEVKECAQQ